MITKRFVSKNEENVANLVGGTPRTLPPESELPASSSIYDLGRLTKQLHAVDGRCELVSAVVAVGLFLATAFVVLNYASVFSNL